jgi:hypothetical protein
MVSHTLRALIVSDAHMGWASAEQPSTDAQQQALNEMLKLAGPIDLFIDTGDAFHAHLGHDGMAAAARSWLDVIETTAAFRPFIYVPGNHELHDFSLGNTEEIAARLGSHVARPYFAVQHRGINFVSLPQLVDPGLVTAETLNWLETELSKHSALTTIILAHNSLAGTTNNGGNPIYRSIVNSETIRRILEGRPNVVAWFHGHNHHFEIVQSRPIHVSNGRIGGFDPPWGYAVYGKNKIGGILLEVSKSSMLIRAVNATDRTFFDQAGFQDLTLTRQINTTYSHCAESTYSYGHGLLLENQTFPLRRHFVPGPISESRYDLEGTQKANPILTYVAIEALQHPMQMRLFGAKLLLFNAEPRVLDSCSFTLLPTSKRTKSYALIVFPRERKGHYAPYFQFLPGDDVQFKLKLASSSCKVLLAVNFRDSTGKFLSSSKRSFSIDGQTSEMRYHAKAPEAGQHVYASVSLLLSEFHESVQLSNFELTLKPRETTRSNLRSNPTYVSQNEAAVSALESSSSAITLWGHGIFNWQIRNGEAELVGDTLVVTASSSGFSSNRRVHLAPSQPERFSAYVYRVEGSGEFETKPATVGASLFFRSNKGNARIWIRHGEYRIFSRNGHPIGRGLNESIFELKEGADALFYAAEPIE